MTLALYRKYRPQSFAEVIGQEHVTEPLISAIGNGRLNHAYLFSGPRGCGKTSSARILARSLNCAKGPTPTPCGECDSCVGLSAGGGGSIDVIEIDAASHGGVDDARELRERAVFAPVSSRFKIYVIDEAHMVSSAGFNALLKLVEEPPDYVMFVFATTEPEKVLPTIRSRTHHYPFRLIPPVAMRGLCEKLCREEGITVEEAVYPLVIRAGAGSARDTLSVLDQLIAGAGPEGVTYARAVSLLGVTDGSLLDGICEALSAMDGAGAIGVIDKALEAGHDPRRFASDLLERLRDLIVLNQVPDAGSTGLIDVPSEVLERMTGQAIRMGTPTLTRMAEIFHGALSSMRGTTAPRLLLELACARAVLPSVDDSAAGLLQRIDQLERRIADGVPMASRPGLPAPAPAASPPAPAGLSGREAAKAAAASAASGSGGGGASGQGEAAAAAQAAGGPSAAAGGHAASGSRDGSGAGAAVAGQAAAGHAVSGGAGGQGAGREGVSGSGLGEAAAAQADGGLAAATSGSGAGGVPASGPGEAAAAAAGYGSASGDGSVTGPASGGQTASGLRDGSRAGDAVTAAQAASGPAAATSGSGAGDAAVAAQAASGSRDGSGVGGAAAAAQAAAGGAAGDSPAAAGGQDAAAGALAEGELSADVSTQVAGSAGMRPSAAAAAASWGDEPGASSAPSGGGRVAQAAASGQSVPASGQGAVEGGGQGAVAASRGQAGHTAPPSQSAAAGAAPAGGDRLARVRGSWEQVKQAVKDRKKTVAAFLMEATVTGVDGDTLVLTFRHAFHANALTGDTALPIFTSALSSVLGGSWRVRCEIGEATAPPPRPAPQRSAPPAAAGPGPSGPAAVEEEPLPPEPEPEDYGAPPAAASNGSVTMEQAVEMFAKKVGAKKL